MAQDDLFCKIARGDIPADIVYQDEGLVAFRDINPQAPTHILIVPKKHLTDIQEITEKDADLLNRIFLVAAKLARQEGIAETGFRLVVNNGPDAGQSVQHIHFHLLGGRGLGWPPG